MQISADGASPSEAARRELYRLHLPAYQNLRQRVDSFVSNHLAGHTWSPHLNKNQLRNNIRQQVLNSGMLESGIDRIISQVVDPKINQMFRPQVEKAVHEFLNTVNIREEASVTSTHNEEKSDSSGPATQGLSAVSTGGNVASDAMSILETISSLNQEACAAARSFTDNPSLKGSDRTFKKVATQQGTDSNVEKEHNLEEVQEKRDAQDKCEIQAEVTETGLKQDELHDATCQSEEVINLLKGSGNVSSIGECVVDNENKKSKLTDRIDEKKEKLIEKIDDKKETEKSVDLRTKLTKGSDKGEEQKAREPDTSEVQIANISDKTEEQKAKKTDKKDMSDKGDKKEDNRENKTEKKDDKREIKADKKNDYSKKSDDRLKAKEEKPNKERAADSGKQTIYDKPINRQRNTQLLKEEYSSEDSDMDSLSDITVSSVHTSDLSSFEEESEGQAPVSDSTEEGEITSDDEDNLDMQSKATPHTDDQVEGKTKVARHSYVHKPYLYSRYYSDSDDEQMVEQRRQSVARAKEERLLRRQINREKLEEKRKLKASEKAKNLKSSNTKNTGKVGGEGPSSKGSMKEVLKEQKFLEKKVALSIRRQRESRFNESSWKKRYDYSEEDSRDSYKTSETSEKLSSTLKDTKHSKTESQQKSTRRCSEPQHSTEEKKDDTKMEREQKKRIYSLLEVTAEDSEPREAKKRADRVESNHEEHQKKKSVPKTEKQKKDGNLADTSNSRSTTKKEVKSNRDKGDRDRSLSDDKSSSRHHRHKTDSVPKSLEDVDRRSSERGLKGEEKPSKSSSDDKSERKSKHKSERKPLAYSREVKTGSECAVKTDESFRKENNGKERSRSTEKSRAEHKSRRSTSDSKIHRASPGSLKQNTSGSQKKTESHSEDKYDLDSTNSDSNSKHDESIHKDRRRTKSSSDEKSSLKIKSKSSNKSSKCNEGELQEASQKPDKDSSLQVSDSDKSHVDNILKETIISKLQRIAYSGVSPEKESHHKMKSQSGDKVSERIKSDHKEPSQSKPDKKSSTECNKSRSFKQCGKESKRKGDATKLDDKPVKHVEENPVKMNGGNRVLDKKLSNKLTLESKKEDQTKREAQLLTAPSVDCNVLAHKKIIGNPPCPEQESELMEMFKPETFASALKRNTDLPIKSVSKKSVYVLNRSGDSSELKAVKPAFSLEPQITANSANISEEHIAKDFHPEILDANVCSEEQGGYQKNNERDIIASGLVVPESPISQKPQKATLCFKGNISSLISSSTSEYVSECPKDMCSSNQTGQMGYHLVLQPVKKPTLMESVVISAGIAAKADLEGGISSASSNGLDESKSVDKETREGSCRKIHLEGMHETEKRDGAFVPLHTEECGIITQLSEQDKGTNYVKIRQSPRTSTSGEDFAVDANAGEDQPLVTNRTSESIDCKMDACTTRPDTENVLCSTVNMGTATRCDVSNDVGTSAQTKSLETTAHCLNVLKNEAVTGNVAEGSGMWVNNGKPKTTAHHSNTKEGKEVIVESGTKEAIGISLRNNSEEFKNLRTEDLASNNPVCGTSPENKVESTVIDLNTEGRTDGVRDSKKDEEATSSSAVMDRTTIRKKAGTPLICTEKDSEHAATSSGSVMGKNIKERAFCAMKSTEKDIENAATSSTTVVDRHTNTSDAFVIFKKESEAATSSSSSVMSTSNINQQEAEGEVPIMSLEYDGEDSASSSGSLVGTSTWEGKVVKQCSRNEGDEAASSSGSLMERDAGERAASSSETMICRNTEERTASSSGTMMDGSTEARAESSSGTLLDGNTDERAASSSETLVYSNTQERAASSSETMVDRNIEDRTSSSSETMAHRNTEEGAASSSETMVDRNTKERTASSSETMVDRNTEERTASSSETMVDRNTEERTASSSETMVYSNIQERAASSSETMMDRTIENRTSSSSETMVHRNTGEGPASSSEPMVNRNTEERAASSSETMVDRNIKDRTSSSSESIVHRNTGEGAASSSETMVDRNTEERTASSSDTICDRNTKERPAFSSVTMADRHLEDGTSSSETIVDRKAEERAASSSETTVDRNIKDRTFSSSETIVHRNTGEGAASSSEMMVDRNTEERTASSSDTICDRNTKELAASSSVTMVARHLEDGTSSSYSETIVDRKAEDRAASSSETMVDRNIRDRTSSSSETMVHRNIGEGAASSSETMVDRNTEERTASSSDTICDRNAKGRAASSSVTMAYRHLEDGTSSSSSETIVDRKAEERAASSSETMVDRNLKDSTSSSSETMVHRNAGEGAASSSESMVDRNTEERTASSSDTICDRNTKEQAASSSVTMADRHLEDGTSSSSSETIVDRKAEERAASSSESIVDRNIKDRTSSSSETMVHRNTGEGAASSSETMVDRNTEERTASSSDTICDRNTKERAASSSVTMVGRHLEDGTSSFSSETIVDRKAEEQAASSSEPMVHRNSGEGAASSSETIVDRNTEDRTASSSDSTCDRNTEERAASSSETMLNRKTEKRTASSSGSMTDTVTEERTATSSGTTMDQNASENTASSSGTVMYRNSDERAASSSGNIIYRSTEEISASSSGTTLDRNAEDRTASSSGREMDGVTGEKNATSSGTFMDRSIEERAEANMMCAQKNSEDATSSSSTSRDNMESEIQMNKVIICAESNENSTGEADLGNYVCAASGEGGSVSSATFVKESDISLLTKPPTESENDGTMNSTINGEGRNTSADTLQTETIVIFNQTEEKEDAVSSASSEEKHKTFVQGSREDFESTVTERSEIEGDGTVTSAGMMTGVASLACENSVESENNVSCANIEKGNDADDVTCAKGVYPVSEAATLEAITEEYDGDLTGDNVEERLVERDFSDTFTKRDVEDAMTSTVTDQQGQTALVMSGAEEGDSAVTSTGITVEEQNIEAAAGTETGNDGDSLICSDVEEKDDDDVSLNRTDAKEGDFSEDDESAITSTGTKEEEEGEGIVTSTGTGNEDSSSCTGQEEIVAGAIIPNVEGRNDIKYCTGLDLKKDDGMVNVTTVGNRETATSVSAEIQIRMNCTSGNNTNEGIVTSVHFVNPPSTSVFENNNETVFKEEETVHRGLRASPSREADENKVLDRPETQEMPLTATEIEGCIQLSSETQSKDSVFSTNGREAHCESANNNAVKCMVSETSVESEITTDIAELKEEDQHSKEIESTVAVQKNARHNVSIIEVVTDSKTIKDSILECASISKGNGENNSLLGAEPAVEMLSTGNADLSAKHISEQQQEQVGDLSLSLVEKDGDSASKKVMDDCKQDTRVESSELEQESPKSGNSVDMINLENTSEPSENVNTQEIVQIEKRKRGRPKKPLLPAQDSKNPLKKEDSDGDFPSDGKQQTSATSDDQPCNDTEVNEEKSSTDDDGAGRSKEPKCKTGRKKKTSSSSTEETGTPSEDSEKCGERSSTDDDASDKSKEYVPELGRKPKRSFSATEETDSLEPKSKHQRTESATKEHEEEDDDEEEEGDDNEEDDDDDEDDDDNRGATTRAASRLEAQRKQPHKPTTRAASKLGIPEPLSPRDRRSTKDKLTADAKSGKSSQLRSKTQNATSMKRRREASPQAVKSRGQQTPEETQIKRRRPQ
ncbi:biorientation of chromosomes in cell division protein 1-like 1 isoform X2 [Ambystoma mexicanum]|uniref:biorientation of chromosomes in cell division protein 1-like 1 isoform X2 n=1 Tax=Ambystoma mexicanum TaxID=8296 RepID=UPI0037E9B09F